MRRSRAEKNAQLKTQKPKTNKLWGWTKFFGFVLIMAFALCLGGFLKFTSIVSSASPARVMPKADGIVVWTGKGGGRLEAATQLLQNDHGERLLISGVNKSNSREDIKALLGVSDDLDACCLDLDYAAVNTIGNARETSIWAQALGYEHIILVTSAYHMPRARVEMSSAAGRIRITPYPVVSSDTREWWRGKKQFDRYAREYGKLLGSLLRQPRELTTAGTPAAGDNGELMPAKVTDEDAATP